MMTARRYDLRKTADRAALAAEVEAFRASGQADEIERQLLGDEPTVTQAMVRAALEAAPMGPAQHVSASEMRTMLEAALAASRD